MPKECRIVNNLLIAGPVVVDRPALRWELGL